MCAEMSSSSSACWALPIAPHCPQHWLFVLESKCSVYPFPALHDLAECGKNDISPPVSVTLKLMNVSAALKAVCMCLRNTNNAPDLGKICRLSCWEDCYNSDHWWGDENMAVTGTLICRFDTGLVDFTASCFVCQRWRNCEPFVSCFVRPSSQKKKKSERQRSSLD